MDVGSLMRAAQVERGLGQATLARRAATTQTYVSRVERGDVAATMPTVRRLFAALGLELRLELAPLGCGNEDPARLRADYLASTPEQRVDDAMRLSTFVTGIATDAAERG